VQFQKSYTGQFAVAAKGGPPLAGAERLSLHSVDLDFFPGIGVVAVHDRSGARVGVLLGVPIDLSAGVVLKDKVVLDGNLSTTEALDFEIERTIYALAGSFIFILDAPGHTRIYLDANGSLSLVYDPERRVAAATTGLLLSDEEYASRLRADMYEAFEISRDGWFTAGLTAHSGIRRLLCNHYLDLNTGEEHRHWPKVEIDETETPDLAIARINQIVRRTTEALLSDGPVSIALTAGNETRALLANYRGITDKLNFVTLDSPGYRLDLVRAKELAQSFNLKHCVLPYRPANDVQIESWKYRSSHGITGNNMTGHPSIAPLAGDYFVGGLGGEVGRGFLWLNADNDTKLDTFAIVDRLKLPRHPMILEAVGNWLELLPDKYSTLFTLDLAYIELRMSCWAFAQAYASPHVVKIYPLISRASYEAMLSLPPSFRRDNGMIKACIEQSWPETLSYPINRYGDFRDRLELAERAIRKPYRAWKKLRQLLKARTH
jgi:hypothetical protein